MKSKAYKNSKLKHQLLEKKRRKQKNPCWRLSEEERDFIINELHFEIRPIMFEVKTKPINLEENSCYLLKNISHLYEKGVRTKICRLNKKERDILDEMDIEYGPFREEIILN